MNVFISWSGDLSKKIAEVLKDWIPTVLQSAKPYFTPDDIEKGSKWETEITKKLNESNIGIICLTVENTEKPWILFEAGALSNKLDKSRVCPLLFGLSNANLTGPLATFQTTVFEKNEFKKLMKSLNTNLEDKKIAEKIFNDVFDTFYPRLEDKINELLKEHDAKTVESDSEKIDRTDRDILEEILELTRRQYQKPKSIHTKDSSGNEIELVKSKILSFMADNNYRRLKDYATLDPDEVYLVLREDAEVRNATKNGTNLKKIIRDFIEG